MKRLRTLEADLTNETAVLSKSLARGSGRPALAPLPQNRTVSIPPQYESQSSGSAPPKKRAARPARIHESKPSTSYWTTTPILTAPHAPSLISTVMFMPSTQPVVPSLTAHHFTPAYDYDPSALGAFQFTRFP